MTEPQGESGGGEGPKPQPKLLLGMFIGLVLVSFLASQLNQSGGFDNPLSGLTGPPSDVSREYARELLQQSPHQAGEEIYFTRPIIGCMQSWLRGLERHSHIANWHPWRVANHGSLTSHRPIYLTNINVSGVRPGPNDSKIIEYTADHDFGNLDVVVPRCSDEINRSPRTALAQRYDDGWRIQHVINQRDQRRR